jgi:hypothetical protein
MPSHGELEFGEQARFAFVATPAVLRALVAQGKPGAYTLLQMGLPIYVGRSDHCLQTRLVGHPLLPVATHVAWQTCSSPLEAYRLESAWFHQLRAAPSLINKIHPARPAGADFNCPFCSTGDCLAWAHLMRSRQEGSAAPTVAAELMATAAKTEEYT